MTSVLPPIFGTWLTGPVNLGCAVDVDSDVDQSRAQVTVHPIVEVVIKFALDNYRCTAWLPCWNHTNHTVVPRGHGLAKCQLSVVKSASRPFPLSEQHFLTSGRGSNNLYSCSPCYPSGSVARSDRTRGCIASWHPTEGRATSG